MMMTNRKPGLPNRLTRAAVRLVALFGRAAWQMALGARDLSPFTAPVRAAKAKATIGRSHFRYRIHLGGSSIRKVQRYLDLVGPMLTADFVFAVSQRIASPIRAPA